VTRDRESLQSWYRDAMRGRIDELVALRRRLEEGDLDACEGVRRVGQALRGSGGTFGFEEVSAVARLVETTTEAAALMRTEAMIDFLSGFTRQPGQEGALPSWLARAAGLGDDRDFTPPASVRRGERSIADAWSWVLQRAGLEEADLAERVAARFGLEVADCSERSQAAARLVPSALVMEQRIVPLREDPTAITVATSNPLSLPAEVEIERLTGRRVVFSVAGPSAISAELAAPGGVPDDGGARLTSPAAEWRILLVDDDPSARLLLRTLLAKRDFRTAEAGDGIEALAAMRDDPSIAMAVVDLNMPRMDGLELLWAIRDSSRWCDLPVLVVTGEPDEVLETQVMEEGADDYIRKPVDPRLFLARVEATLRRSGLVIQ